MRRGGLLGGLLLAAAACVTPPLPAPGPERDVDPAAYWEAVGRGDRTTARRLAAAFGWEERRSVEGERLRQRLLVEEGRRGAAVAEVRRWLAADPDSPDLLYLEARLLQDPVRQARRFRALVRRFPGHPWIRLGAASLALDAGRIAEAADHLAAAPSWPETLDFRARVEARLLAARGRSAEALERLEEAAFGLGDLGALADHAGLALAAGDEAAAARSWTALALRRLPEDATPAERVDAAAARLQAEIGAGRISGLDEAVAFLDRCSRLAGLPEGWRRHPRLAVPLVGGLLRVEATEQEPAATWARAGRRLVLGQAPGVGLEALLLQDVQARTVDLPGLGPAELLLAASARSRDGRSPFTGAAVLAGFFVRADLAGIQAAAVLPRLAHVDPEAEPLLPTVDSGGGGALPENWDLDLRLRARVLAEAGRTAGVEVLTATWFHEAGHLPETLPWFRGERSFLADLPAFLGGLLRDGDPIAWLEARAQLRALAAAPDPRWLLADTVEQARQARGRYPRAYRWVLRALVEAGRAQGLPDPARWDRLEPERLRSLARTALAARGLRPLEEPAARLLDRILGDFVAGLPADALDPAVPAPVRG